MGRLFPSSWAQQNGDCHWRPRASQEALVVKNLPASSGDIRDGVRSLGQEGPWRRTWWPTPAFFPVETHGQRRLLTKSWTQLKQLSAHAYTEGTSQRTPENELSRSFLLTEGLGIYLHSSECHWNLSLSASMLTTVWRAVWIFWKFSELQVEKYWKSLIAL